MILIGQYDSPFVRRVAVALNLYGMGYEHRPWSTFGDAEKLAAYNPLSRVPTLVLESGEVLIESGAILDHLDECAGADAALIARSGSERRATLKLCALATGLCDKMVSLVYESALHEQTSSLWIARCEKQVGAVLDLLESGQARRGAEAFAIGEHLTHADIAITCAMRFLAEAHPAIHALARWPALTTLAARCEAMEAFRSVIQVFIPPR